MYIKFFLVFSISISAFCFSQRSIENKKLYIFIGKKISIKEFNPNLQQEKSKTKELDPETGDTLTVTHQSYIMDNAFHCIYLVIKNLKNHLIKENVEFNAYDHYDRPGFEKYENVILYISKNKNGNFFHQKYMYDPVYKINGKWVGILSFIFPNNNLKQWKKFKTVNINKSYTIKEELGSCDKECQKIYYPSPYFEIKNGFAYPKKAFEINDIISYRKKTTLKAKD